MVDRLPELPRWLKLTKLRDSWRRLRRWPAMAQFGFLATAIMTAAVILAATWPGSTSRAGEWRPLVDSGALGVAIQVNYAKETGEVQLRLDRAALNQVIPDARKRRWVVSHLRRFNRNLSGRRFDAKRIPGDSIFQVEMVGQGDQRQPKLKMRDLSPFNTHPVQRHSDRRLGPVFMRPGDKPTPFLSDGFLGLTLEPGDGPTKTVKLNQPGLYHANRFHLVDERGQGVATIWPGEDSERVFIQGEAGRGVFINNNAPLDDDSRGLGAGDMVELAGRFFEVRIEAAPVLAMSADRGQVQKRIYPMGNNLHFVGPVSLNGRHQSLGLEYMFQEYLAGLPEADISPGELWLTLDPRLQGAWVAGMSQLAQRSERKSGRRASGMLMDAKTGAILAMAAEQKPYDPGDTNQILNLLDSGEERFANHGCFRRHVIGSVTKPFFAFLALALDPEWEKVRVNVVGESTTTLYGHRLYGRSDKAMAFKRNQIGFDTYLIQSDNAFQHSLGLLMLAGLHDLEQVPSPWLTRGKNGEPILRPTANSDQPLTLDRLGVRGRDSLTVARDSAFATAARAIFDLETAPPGVTNDDRDLGIFEGFLPTAEALLMRHNPRLQQPREVLKRRSVVCAPEYPRLALESVTNTKDASNLLFGGNFNLWTDVKLCEAFSRMITGRRVRAQIIQQYRDTLADGELVNLVEEATPFQVPEEIANPNAFRTMRKHLGEVPIQGTGRQIASTIGDIRKMPGQANFRIFAKTGTIDDGEGSDSRLFLATFGLWDNALEDFQGSAYTFVVYLRNSKQENDILDFIQSELPKWWRLLQPPTTP